MKKILSLPAVVLFLTAFAQSQALPDNNSAKTELQKTNAEAVRFYGQKKYDEALPPAQTAVQLSERQFGKNSLDTAKALRNLGFIQNAKNDAKAAENTFERALEIYKKSPDLDKQTGAGLADMIEALAVIKYQRRMDSAENLFEQALSWREKTAGPDSIKTAAPLTALANISYWRKDYKKAAALFQRLLEVNAKTAGATAPDTSLAFYRTECAYRKAGMEKDFQPVEEKYSRLKSQMEKDADNLKAVQVSNLINKDIINGQALSLPRPPYPAEARQAHAEGTVKVNVLINEQGSVIHACGAAKSNPLLVEASEISAYQSKFSPTILEGKPVRVYGVIVYNFVK